MEHVHRGHGILRRAGLVALPVLLLVGCRPEPQLEVEVPPPPETETGDVVEEIHGVDVADPYRWLEEQQAERTRQWIERQNEYTDAVLDQLPGRAALEERVSRLIKIDTVGFPVARQGRYFFMKRKAGQDLSVLYLREGIDGEDEVLIDPHGLSEDHTTSITLMDVSRDGTLVAYGIRQGGQDEVEVRLFDVEARENLPDRLPRGRYFGVSITPDNEGFYYTRHDEEGPRVRYHAVGTGPAEDRTVFGEGYGADKLIFAALSEDGRWITFNVLYGSAADKSEIYLQDLAEDGPVQAVVTDLEARFTAQVLGGRLWIRTNWEAPNGRILAADPAAPGLGGWEEVVPEREDAVIESTSGVGGRLFVNYLEDVKSRVVAYAPDGEELGAIEFDTLGTVGDVGGTWHSEEAFFLFTSFHVPTTVYRYDVASGERQVWDAVDIPVDTSGFTVEQVFYSSKDGTEVPMFLVHREGIELDGDNPTLLTGYGGFNASLTPRFSAATALWVESGGVYAVANLRGGGEYGEAWHKAGMLGNKQNVFDDFLAAAEHLIESGYTRPERLAIRGGSNGGLLVGAAMTQRPELFEAVVCAYPLLDMLRYHKFMVARFWVPEYGSAEDPEQFEYLLDYSPYHNVEEGEQYPAVLFITGDGDTRVAPLHARKMAARVQAANASDEPILLRYHTKAGHAGGMPVSEEIDNLTDAMSFLFWQLGMELPVSEDGAAEAA